MINVLYSNNNTSSQTNYAISSFTDNTLHYLENFQSRVISFLMLHNDLDKDISSVSLIQ